MSSPTNGFVDRISTLLLGCLLALALVTGLAPNTSTRLVGLGESIWPGYAAELRSDPQIPTCEVEPLKKRADACVDSKQPARGTVDPFAEPDPFAELEPSPKPAVDPFAEPAPKPAVDPFAEPAPKPAVDPFAEPAPKPALDPFAEPTPKPNADPFAEPEPAPAADPFAAAPVSSVNCAAVRALSERCESRHAAFQSRSDRITSEVRWYRMVEGWVGQVALFPFHKHVLVLLVLIGGFTTSRHGVHIALRNPATAVEHRVSNGAQLLAHLIWLGSCVADIWIQNASSAPSDNPALPWLWSAGFLVLASVHAGHLVRPPRFEADASTSAVRAVMSIPLYAFMGLLATLWYAVDLHPSGQAIALNAFLKVPNIYVGIGLYIWAGMLLARTSLASRVFDMLMPWKLPPAILGWLVVVLAALPTAYSGASGIFVIAAGAVIFERLTQAGASPRIALAATAMSGSLGVVLRPCLVVVLVAVLNKSVTTDALFGWGLWVFALTAGLFLIAMIWRNDQPFVIPPVGAAAAETFTAFRGLVPALVLMLLGLVVYGVFLGTTVTENTAALVLPGLLLAVALYDRTLGRVDGPEFLPALSSATAEGAHHIGALLFVMAGSVGLGSVVERAELLDYLPSDFGSKWAAMAFLVVVMVLVGMTMDALGAVILVSVSLAHVAEANGIDAVHFWMMVLCAFELGYLTPPVALNHLLARQVIGEASYVENLPADTFFEQNEHILVPMGVMATALVIVAFGPLLFGA